MYKIITGLTILILFSCSDIISETENSTGNWSRQKRELHLENLNRASTWDEELLEGDKQLIGISDLGPFEIGVFPVPRYDLLGEGSFNGMGNKSGEFKAAGQILFMNSFFVTQNELNRIRLKGMNDQVFFQIIVLKDSIDEENDRLSNSITISRNHPDYMGQGFIETKNSKIEYLAFVTAENEAFAIINTRIFNLDFGRTILIKTLKNGTLRSKQINSPALSSDAIIEYTNKLVKSEAVIEFFKENGNI